MILATSNFLVPNGTIVVEVIAFLIVVAFVAKVVLPPLNQMAEKRQAEIAESLGAAEAARAEADRARGERERTVEEARAEARQIVAQANRTAEQVVADARARAEEERSRLVASAGEELALARRRAVEEVSAEVAALVLAVARQVVGREVDAAAHRDLIDEAVEVLRSGDAMSRRPAAGVPAAGAPSASSASQE